jgi:hypothetical protein
MSWAENEKLDQWIQRAYENGKREEQERIIKSLEVGISECDSEDCDFCIVAKDLIYIVKGENK